MDTAGLKPPNQARERRVTVLSARMDGAPDATYVFISKRR